MANDFSDALDGSLLDAAFGGVAYTGPATVYVSAHTADPGKTGTNEVATANNYARVALTNNTTNFPNSSGSPRTKTNGAAITFNEASGSWGTITYLGFWTASSAGTFMGRALLGTPQTIGNLNTLFFNIGDVSWSLN